MKKNVRKWGLLGGILVIAITIWAWTFFVSSKPAATAKEINYTNSQLQQMYNLGFVSVKGLNGNDQFDYAIHPDRVKYYHDKYNLRYFSEEGLQRMLNQFNYVMANPWNYTGSIPAENLIAIQKAKDAHYKIVDTLYSPYYSNSTPHGTDVEEVIDPKVINPMVIATVAEGKIPVAGNVWYRPIDGAFTLGYFDKYLHATPDLLKKPIERALFTQLKIVGPENEFTFQANEHIVNHKVENKPPVKDPIVLGVVPDGYVLVTQW